MKFPRIVLVVSLVTALLAPVVASAAANSPPPAPGANPAAANPATPNIETGRPGQDTANTQDQLFMRQIAIGNSAEIALANLAKARGADDGVKRFATRMSGDHQMSMDKLKPLMKRNATPMQKQLDMDHQVVQGQLEKLRGGAFDTAYIRSQIVDHQKTVQLLEWEVGFGQSDAIKSYAKENLPVVMEHLEMARAIHAKLTGAAP
jgi:putative membrane protein